MPIERSVKRIKEEFQRRFRLAGKGSVGRVQEQLGLGKRFFSNQRRKGRQRFDAKVVFDALKALAVDPAEFFTAALGPADPVAAFRGEAATLLWGCKRPPRILVLEAERDPQATGSPVEVDFSELDALRYDEPKQVKRQVKTLISSVDAAQVPRLLGCYASACRVEGKLDEAHIVLGRALDLAVEGDRDASFADLILRTCAVAGDRGQFEVAVALAERATLEYFRQGDLPSVGKSLVEQAIWIFFLGRYREAVSTFESALKLFGHDDSPAIRRNRVCCLVNCAIACQRIREFERAEELLLEARKGSSAVGSVLLGQIVTLQASIAKHRGDFDRAEAYLLESIDARDDRGPLETAYSVVELCRLRLLQGRISEAHETGKILLPLLDRIEKNPSAAAYVTDFLRCAVAGQGLSIELLDRVARGLKKGRAQLEDHARRKR